MHFLHIDNDTDTKWEYHRFSDDKKYISRNIGHLIAYLQFTQIKSGTLRMEAEVQVTMVR